MARNSGIETRKPLKWWDALTKTVVGIDYQESRYEVELDFFSLGKDAALYRDGKLVERQDTAARFELSGNATIEVDTSSFGIKKAILITPDGQRAMSPLPETIEYKRIRWDQANPHAARVLAVTSWLILAVAAIVGVPQLIELLSGTEIAEDIGFSFTSPFQLSSGQNTALTLLAIAAAIERGTRMKYNWWLEGLSDDIFG